MNRRQNILSTTVHKQRHNYFCRTVCKITIYEYGIIKLLRRNDVVAFITYLSNDG